jgi:hypothetical protein
MSIQRANLARNFQFAYLGAVVEGHFNGTPLSGLNWSFICIIPDEIEEGNGKCQIIIDERADEAQRAGPQAKDRKSRHPGCREEFGLTDHQQVQ